MGAPQPLTFQPLVGGARHVTVAEVQQLDSPSDFRLAQKQGGCRVKLVSHIDVYSDSGLGAFREEHFATNPCGGEDKVMLEERTYDDRDGWIWLDGKLAPWRVAHVHILTHDLHHTSSAMTGQRLYNGTIFRQNGRRRVGH